MRRGVLLSIWAFALACALGACGGAEPVPVTLATTTKASTADTRPSSVDERVRAVLLTHEDLGETWVRDPEEPRFVRCESDPWKAATSRRWTPIYRSGNVALQQIAAAYPSAREARRSDAILTSEIGQRCFHRTLLEIAEEQLGGRTLKDEIRVVLEGSAVDGVGATRSIAEARNGDPAQAVFIDEIRARRGGYLTIAVAIVAGDILQDPLHEAIAELLAERVRAAAA